MKTIFSKVILSATAFALTAGATQVLAQQELVLNFVDRNRVRVDGALPEWRGIRFTSLGEGDDGSMRFALGYDSGGIYLAATVNDDQLVRNREPGADEDAIILTLAMPAEGTDRLVGSEIWLYAGIPGRQAASASIGGIGEKPQPMSGVAIVEGPPPAGASGYVLEAYIPWDKIPGGRRWNEARAAIRLRDVDRRAKSASRPEPASAIVRDPADLEQLPALVRSGQRSKQDPLKSFLCDHDMMGMRPKFDLKGDVSGDNRLERVNVINTYVVITGPGHQGGDKYTYIELPITGEADVLGARLQDLTGDGKAELLLEFRQRAGTDSRVLWQALSLLGSRPEPLLTVLLRHEQPEGFAQASLSVKPGRGAELPGVEVQADKTYGLNQYNYRETPLASVEPLLTPWGPAQERVYRWDGGRFAVLSEQPSPAAVKAAAAARSAESDRAQASARINASTVEALVEAFRQALDIPADEQPRFTQKADVAEGKERETLMVFGKILLVVGPGFRGGTGYFYSELPVLEPDDVIKVTAADITNDRQDEVFIRVRQRLGDMSREILLVHRFNQASFQRLLAVEVKRQQGENCIENQARVKGSGKNAVLEIRPGRAKGWSEENFPFLLGSSGGIEPLLLPWKDTDTYYRYDGQRLVK